MSDKTLKDLDRRHLSFTRSEVTSLLPEYYVNYPKLIDFLEKYYQFLDSDNGTFGHRIHTLPSTRDIGQTLDDNLSYIEDELLLGQNYLEGILDKRTGAELSNNYYRTKGTKFSIERFFRSFYNEDPDIIYGKDITFGIGNTIIGPNSGKYIQNDKIYQFWGILIRTGIPQSEWLELYKLFAHPGGMYVGSEVLIEADASVNPAGAFYLNDFDSAQITYLGYGKVNPAGYSEVTSYILSDSDTQYRIDPSKMLISQWDDLIDSTATTTGEHINSVYTRSFINPMLEGSPTTDQDSNASSVIDLSIDYLRADEDKYETSLDSSV